MKTMPVAAMPVSKFRMYVTLFILAIAALAVAYGVGLLTVDRVVVTLFGIVVSILLTTSTDLYPEIARRLDERSRRGRFRAFFGQAAWTHPVSLVFARRRLKEELIRRNPWVTHHPTPVGVSAEGVNAWLAFQDIRAATYLANALYEMTGQGVELVHDADVMNTNWDRCLISLGLGFNGFTNLLAELCDNRLFRVEFGPSPKDAQFLTDLFLINGQVPIIPDGKDHCLVARVVLPTIRADEPRICFVCAGRTASGTAAAGFYLARKWEHLLNLYAAQQKNLDRDSLVVVVSHTHDAHGEHEYDMTGEIVPELCAWHRAAGLASA